MRFLAALQSYETVLVNSYEIIVGNLQYYETIEPVCNLMRQFFFTSL